MEQEEAQNDNVPAEELENVKESEEDADKDAKNEKGVDPEELAAKLRELQQEESEKEISEEQETYDEEFPEDSHILDEGILEESEEYEEEEIHELTKISIRGLYSRDESADEDSEQLWTWEEPIIYGNVRMFLGEHKVLERQREEKSCPDLVGRLYREDARRSGIQDTLVKDLSIGLESVWWKERMGCGMCPSNITCSCGLTLPEIVINLSQYFHLIVIPHKSCTTCLQILDEIRKKDVTFCQINLEDIEETQKADLRKFLENPGDLSLRLVHHWSHEDGHEATLSKVVLLNEKLVLPASDYFDIIVIGTSAAARGIALEAVKCQLSVCIVEVPKEGSDSFWGFEKSYSYYSEAIKKIFLKAVDVQKAFKHGQYNGLGNTDQGFFDWEMFRRNALRYMESLAWQHRVSLRKEGTLYVTGAPYVVNKNTIQVKLRFGDTLELRGKNIILAMGRKMEYNHFPGLHRYCYKVEKLLSVSHFGVSKVLLCGGGTSVLEYGEIFHSLGMDVTIMMDSAFPRTYDSDILKMLMDYMEGNGVKIIRNSRVHRVLPVVLGANGTVTIPDVTEKLIVIGNSFETGKYTKYFVDYVIVLPRSAAWCPVNGLAEVGVNFCRFNPNLVLVNDNLRTSVSNIYAVGGVVEGVQDPEKQYEISGRHLAQYIAGKILKVPKLDGKLGQLLTRPEYCFYGPSEAVAKEYYGEEVAVYQTRLPATNPYSAVPRVPPSFAKLICRKRLTQRNNPREDIIGLHVLGRNFAPEIVSGFSVPLSEGMTKADLDEMIGVQCSTAQALIGMTVLKREDDPSITESICCESTCSYARIEKVSAQKSTEIETDISVATNENETDIPVE